MRTHEKPVICSCPTDTASFMKQSGMDTIRLSSRNARTLHRCLPTRTNIGNEHSIGS